MRAHHWLLLFGLVLVLGGFAAMAIAIVALKFVLWVVGVLFLFGALSGFMRARP